MPYDELMKKYQSEQAKNNSFEMEIASLEAKNISLEREKANLETNNADLTIQNEGLVAENENLRLENQNLRKIIFGSKRERTPEGGENENSEQLSLFAEQSEEEKEQKVQDDTEKQIEEITVSQKKDRKKKEKKAGIKKSRIKDTEKVTIEYVLEDSENLCPVCNSELEEIGTQVVRTEIEYTPAKLEIHTVVKKVYKCTNCGKKDSEKETPTIVEAKVPQPVLTHSFASPSLAAEVLYQKFYMGVPFYRQEKVWDDRGLVLPRSMMANWAIKITEYYFEGLYNLMFEKLKQNNKVGHADETTIQCNKEDGRKANSKSYMWVYVSGEQEEMQGVIFRYEQKRNDEAAQGFLNGFTGILITDGYESYKNIEGLMAHGECWAHARRKFYQSVPLKGKKMDTKALGYPGVNYCDQLFDVERKIAELELNNEERLKMRQEKSAPIFKNFNDWVSSLSQKTILNKKLKEAVTYAQNQKEWLGQFLNYGNIPIDNSRAERTIRPFAIHRKNWLFADSVDGAKTNAVMYSLVESAKLNKLNIYGYIKYLLKEIPQLENLNDKNALEKYLPWSKELPEDILNFQGTYEELDLEKNA